MKTTQLITLSILVSLYFSVPVLAHEDPTHQIKKTEKVDKGLLRARQFFADKERKALAEPFVGVTTSSGKQDDLFSIKKTGVSTLPIVKQAKEFLTHLSKQQKQSVVFPIDDLEWQKWSNVDNGIYFRQGLSLKEMTPQQKNSLFALFNASLSLKGMERVKNIMKTEQALKELNNNTVHLDEDLYFITIMGTPSSTEPWGWQFEGHHLAINYFVLGDQVVMAPAFMGAEPVRVNFGKYKDTVVLQEQQDQGMALMQSLTAKQQQQATIAEKRKTNIKAEANKDNLQLDYEGIKVSQLNEHQQSLLIKLIKEYVDNMNEGHAKIKMAGVKQHLNDTWFAWAGKVSDNAVFYYRIHSPVLLIEFDHQAPIALPGNKDQATLNHIHTIIRTPNGNDYGKDLLRQHLENHHKIN